MTWHYIILFLIALSGFGPMVMESRKGTFDFFNLKNSFILYFVVCLCFSGFISIYTKEVDPIALDVVMYSDYYLKALAASFLGIVFFQAGYYLSGARRLKLPISFSYSWRRFNANLLVGIFYLIGLTSFLVFLQVNGGFSTFLDNREGFRAGGVSGQGILLYPSTQLLVFGALIHLIVNAFHPRKSLQKNKILISILLMLVASIPALIIGFRSFLLLPLLQFLVIWNYGYRKINFKKLLPFGLVFSIVFIFYGIIRAIPSGSDISIDQIMDVVTENPELAYSVVSRVKGTEVVASVIEKLEKTNAYDLGYKALFETFTIIVPTAIWPGKPETSSVRFTTYFFGESLAFIRQYERDSWGGVSPTIIGEIFWHFGWLGVTLGMFLVGSIFRKIYETFLWNRAKMSVLLIYSLLFTICTMMAEAVQGYVNGLVFSSITLAICLFFLRIKLT